jgi:hypothetical protein
MDLDVVGWFLKGQSSTWLGVEERRKNNFETMTKVSK